MKATKLTNFVSFRYIMYTVLLHIAPEGKCLNFTYLPKLAHTA